MKKILLALVVILQGAWFADQAVADFSPDGSYGVGIEFFGPAGISLYDRLDQNHFVQGALAFDSFGDYVITGDYLFANKGDLFHSPQITPYWGVGAFLLYDDGSDLHIYRHRRTYDSPRSYLGGRIPLGINFVIPKTPVQIGVEIIPSILMIPATDAFLAAAFHVRVLFD